MIQNGERRTILGLTSYHRGCPSPRGDQAVAVIDRLVRRSRSHKNLKSEGRENKDSGLVGNLHEHVSYTVDRTSGSVSANYWFRLPLFVAGLVARLILRREQFQPPT